MKKIIGIGNALVDILVHIENDEILDRLGLCKGGMEMIDAQRKSEILEVIAGMPQTVATGGSTSNTMHGLARLGAPAGYIGKVGDDDLGRLFSAECERYGLTPHLITTGEVDTGVAITFISPNAERTFATYLGAAATMQPDQVDARILANYDIIHIEGYLIFNHDLILDVCKKAKAAGLQISMDMASYNLIENNLDFVKMRRGEHGSLGGAQQLLPCGHREGRQGRLLHRNGRSRDGYRARRGDAHRHHRCRRHLRFRISLRVYKRIRSAAIWKLGLLFVRAVDRVCGRQTSR